MATTVTSDNFNDFFISAMNTYGRAEENDQEVPEYTTAEITGANAENYSLPIVVNNNGVLSYGKVPIGGPGGLVETIASEVASDGLLQAITQEQFATIFD